MKELIIDSVDDGCEGFQRCVIEGKVIKSDDDHYFFNEVLEALGYQVVYNNIKESIYE